MKKVIMILVVFIWGSLYPYENIINSTDSSKKDSAMILVRQSNHFNNLNSSEVNELLRLNYYNSVLIKYYFGFSGGLHTGNLIDESARISSKNFLLEFFIRFLIWNDVNLFLSYNYMKSEINPVHRKNYDSEREYISKKAVKLGLLINTFNINTTEFSFLPFISFENNSVSKNVLFNYGAGINLRIPIYLNKINLITSISYQACRDFFSLGGGGFHDETIVFLVGCEILIK